MAAETTAADASAAAASTLPQFEIQYWSSQIFWLFVTFGLLYLVLWRFILPRISEGISERRDRIADDLDTAAKKQQEAEQAKKDYERALADARAKAHNIAETTRKSIDAEIAEEVEASEADFAQKQSDADTRIRDIKVAALANIDTVAADTISDITEKVAGMKPTAAKIKAAIAGVKG